MELAVTETLLNDQGIYFPERAQTNEESILLTHEVNFNVEIMALYHVYPKCGKKSLYMSIYEA
jgi:hypothetical protein